MYDIITAIESGDLWRLDGTGGFTMDSWRALQRLVDANGFDAMIVPDAGEGCGCGIDWVVFDSSKVKCISEHSGLFISDSKSLTDFDAQLVLEKSLKAKNEIERLDAKIAPKI